MQFIKVNVTEVKSGENFASSFYHLFRYWSIPETIINIQLNYQLMSASSTSSVNEWKI